MSIRIDCIATYTVRFGFEVDMTEDEWDHLPELKQRDWIDTFCDQDAMRNAELRGYDVLDITEGDE